MYIFYPNFHCRLYCRAASGTVCRNKIRNTQNEHLNIVRMSKFEHSVTVNQIKLQFNLFKVLYLLEGCLYLILSPSPVKIQIKGEKIVQKSGVQILAPECQQNFPFFSTFSNPPYKAE